MDLTEAVSRRRMVRSFADRPLPDGLVVRMVREALRSPTAGHARGTSWIVLEGHDETARYWDAATTAAWRARSQRWAGLSRAPAVAVALASPGVYATRYDEEDKREGAGTDSWPVPYWFTDAAFGVMTLLLEVTAHGLGACFLGNFRGEAAVLSALGVPGSWRLFGAVAIGYPDAADRPSASLERPGPLRSERVHRGRWPGDR